MGNVAQTYAKDGEISMSKDARFLTFKLRHGTHYQQPLDDPRQQMTRPNMIMHFDEQTVRIDLSSLKMESFSEELFKGKAEVLNINQLSSYRDTSEKYRHDSYVQTYNQFVNQYFFQKSLLQADKTDKDTSSFKLSKYLEAQQPEKRKNVLEGALNMVKSAQSFVEGKAGEERDQRQSSAEYEVEWHKKFTVSFACIILFFVGAPLGAIVRKGGFGMPVVISVILFIMYHVVTITLEKMVLEGKIATLPGMWTSQCVFLPIGLWLSFKAANDSPLFESSGWIKALRNLRFYNLWFPTIKEDENSAANQ
jgi:lipopolysaccharide export system permease protein